MRPITSCALLAVWLGTAVSAYAQVRAKQHSLCVLTFDRTAVLERAAPFFQHLERLGYVDGRNASIRVLSAEGDGARFPALASECVRAKPNVIVVQTTPAAVEAKKATSTIPIVILALGDPVGSGLVDNLARPSGNLTGATFNAPGTAAKRLELLKEALPGAKAVLVLSYLVDPIAQPQVEQLRNAARRLNVKLVIQDTRKADDLPRAFDAAVREGAEALTTTHESFFFLHREQILALAKKHRMPGVYISEPYVESGGLLYFGADLSALYRQSADYVDRVLKGAKPADLPIVQPAQFSLVVNLRSAREMGIAVPQSILVRANRVIQ